MLKITKRTAKKLYNQGREIFLIPCKCSPDNYWIKAMLIQLTPENLKEIEEAKKYDSYVGNVIENEYNFESRVNNFELYNCNYELGYYTHFYINE